MSSPELPDFWNDSESSPEDTARGRVNRLAVLTSVIEHARSRRSLDAAEVATWHKGCFLGLSYVAKQDECFLGAYRGSSHPRLRNLPVYIGGIEGCPPGRVTHAVQEFFETLNARVIRLASKVDPDKDKDEQQLRRVAVLAGWAHGEWVRIHPFANGSGRTARLITNWILVRFGLLPVVGVRPRPKHPYEPAAAASMHGDHRKITAFIFDLLTTVTDTE